MQDYCDYCHEYKEVGIYESLPFPKVCNSCYAEVLEMHDELHADD
jgi:hypothetical protein